MFCKELTTDEKLNERLHATTINEAIYNISNIIEEVKKETILKFKYDDYYVEDDYNDIFNEYNDIFNKVEECISYHVLDNGIEDMVKSALDVIHEVDIFMEKYPKYVPFK